MAETKYGKHVLREAFKTHHQLEGLSANGDEMDVTVRLRVGMLTVQIDTAGAAYPISLDPSTSIYGAGDDGDAYKDTAWRTAYSFFRIDERQVYGFEYWNTFPIDPIVYNGIIDTVEIRYYVYDGIFGGVVTPTSIHVAEQSAPPRTRQRPRLACRSRRGTGEYPRRPHSTLRPPYLDRASLGGRHREGNLQVDGLGNRTVTRQVLVRKPNKSPVFAT